MRMTCFKKLKWSLAGLLVLSIGLCSWGTFSEARKDDFGKKTGSSNKPGTVDGFRTAKFGMKERDVARAIFKDFRVPRSKVNRIVHPSEKTTSLGIEVKDLLPNTGKAHVFYILGYKTKKLIQVNVLWGGPAGKAEDPQSIVNAANQLRSHFIQKGFPEEGMLLNTQLKDGTIVVFRGIDPEGRVALLILNNPTNENAPPNKNIHLRLSYIKNPDTPDVFKIKRGDF